MYNIFLNSPLKKKPKKIWGVCLLKISRDKKIISLLCLWFWWTEKFIRFLVLMEMSTRTSIVL